MEYLDLAIKDVVFTNETIELTYENDEKEIVEKTKEGYKKLYNAWLKENPMFISDKFKTQMRDLTYASNGNMTNLNEINGFLSEGNREKAIEFMTYMRTRDLTYERSKWTKK
jgi:hypothetical protein